MGEETDISIELATDIYVERLHSPPARRCGAPPYSEEHGHPTVTRCPYRGPNTDSNARVVDAGGMFSAGALDLPALSRRHTSGLSRTPWHRAASPAPRRGGRDGRLLLPQLTRGCASPRSALTPKPPGTHAMITDAAVETATAVLEERGWERDEETVEDVRAALEAAQAAIAEEKRRLARERARRQADSRQQARWKHVPPEARAG